MFNFIKKTRLFIDSEQIYKVENYSHFFPIYF